jgi:hypothetical protein
MLNIFKRFLRTKKSPDHALQDFVVGLKSVLGDKLTSVIVYGSYASGEFQDGTSAVNVMVLSRVLDHATLAGLTAPVQAWIDAGHEVPVFARADDFAAMSPVLPIEFLDMADHHRIIFGHDPFPELNVTTERLGFQVEHDLNMALLKLRRSAVLYAQDKKELAQVLTRSIPSVWTLCRALLRLKGRSEPLSKIEAARKLSLLAGFDLALVDQLNAYRQTPDRGKTEKLFSSYLEWVEKLLHYMRTGVSL